MTETMTQAATSAQMEAVAEASPAVMIDAAPQTQDAIHVSHNAGQEEQVHRTQLRSLLEQEDGKFITVCFAKQDGSLRELNGRLGVRKHLRGGSDSLAGRRHLTPYIVVFDVKSMGYRNVNLATTSMVKAHGLSYRVTG